MGYAVIKGVSYVLAHTPDVLIQHGSVQVQSRAKDPADSYLQQLNDHLRPFEDVVSYPANQCYIGNLTPQQLADIPQPWFENKEHTSQQGKFGEIYSQAQFYAMLNHVDVFNLVHLTQEFIDTYQPTVGQHALYGDVDLLAGHQIITKDEILALAEHHQAEVLMMNGELVGCVKAAHDEDENLSAHIMLENLCTKASGVMAAMHLKQQGIELDKVDYLIECSEEACGDINQRGGGNFAKAIGEVIGCNSATGSDVRGFCAAPAHAMTLAAALVKSGVFKNVMVVAGGAVAKLGMNGRDHVKNNMPVLEDCLAGFACMVTENDGISPEINTDIVGRHQIGTGSSPQAVMTALIATPLKNAGMAMTDIDKYSVEMQNPEITKPAGAGNVPESNYKMIAALAVKEGQLERTQLPKFVAEHGMTGFAPTQGHIPSGVPFLGFGREMIVNGDINNFMMVGKGSLFLGRMTNLFDGLSFVVQKNSGKQEEVFDEAQVKQVVAQAMRDVAENLLNREQ
ncbi:ketoacyl-ACP synthase III family protein [Photobacterium sp. SDRW27]|uniref:glycine/sarcosine/betaine reductase complex component C subunit beta n=1 Tax=Photobacterium obscurum TaxID=2829490 RepID=UPI002243A0B3|nr:glycine/sarcosine/betaine reductase complex component C subunit beta [Photobacterium obscurum]MCW8328672.1 ketoacyl-ACP synthase III family protein [Photobacterium obscurum]